jgi:NAD(P)-dependent dehydrogenase (short-subunit alcohol dehydrogenase family)
VTTLAGKTLFVSGDIRDEAQVVRAVAQAVERFGGIDVCVNNASASTCPAPRRWRSGVMT